jgi:hypothetical protein
MVAEANQRSWRSNSDSGMVEVEMANDASRIPRNANEARQHVLSIFPFNIKLHLIFLQLTTPSPDIRSRIIVQIRSTIMFTGNFPYPQATYDGAATNRGNQCTNVAAARAI